MMENGVAEIKSWRQFNRRVRHRSARLLKRLDEFPNAVLVAGCQRSGTTMLSRIITDSHGMVNYWFGKDDELAAALILSGYHSHKPKGRYCFQTTYLNNHYKEYFAHPSTYGLIWLLRNPFSVIYSMCYHWSKPALNELFLQCGKDFVIKNGEKGATRFGGLLFSRFQKACYAYIGKTEQTFIIKKHLGNKMLIVDYDNLVMNKNSVLPKIYSFIELPYIDEYGVKIKSKSLKKADSLSLEKKRFVEELCMPVYKKAKEILDITW